MHIFLSNKTKICFIMGVIVYVVGLSALITSAGIVNGVHCANITAECNVSRVGDLYTWYVTNLHNASVCAYDGDKLLERSSWEIITCYHPVAEECPDANCDPPASVSILIAWVMAFVFGPTILVIIAAIATFCNSICRHHCGNRHRRFCGDSCCGIYYEDEDGSSGDDEDTNSETENADESGYSMEDISLRSSSSGDVYMSNDNKMYKNYISKSQVDIGSGRDSIPELYNSVPELHSDTKIDNNSKITNKSEIDSDLRQT